jgi:hypothetical protein
MRYGLPLAVIGCLIGSAASAGEPDDVRPDPGKLLYPTGGDRGTVCPTVGGARKGAGF